MSVEVVATRKSNTIRNFPCTVLQCPVVLISLKSSLVSVTMSTLKPSMMTDTTEHFEAGLCDLDYKSFCANYLPKFSVDLDGIWCNFETCWSDETHAQFISTD